MQYSLGSAKGNKLNGVFGGFFLANVLTIAEVCSYFRMSIIRTEYSASDGCE